MKKIWPFSFNFLFYAAMACLMPFLVLYFRQLGFTGFQIGLLTGLSPLVSIIAIPFWTSFADKTHHHKFVLSLAITSAVILAPVFLIVKTFVPMIALAALYSFLTAPIVSLVDNATMTMLADEKEKYGRVRVGGTIGWALTAPVAGVLIDRFGLKFSFWSYAVVMLAALFVCQPFIFGQADARVQIKGGIRTLLANRRWMLFLGLGFVGGMGIASVNNYLSLYMTQGGANKTLIGVASAMATFSELPVLFFGDRLLKRFRAQGLFVLAIAVYAVRLLLYAVSDLPAVILPFQLLNGLTFPALWMAGVSLAHENAPRGMGATAQGLFGSVVMGFGNGVGGLLCGTLFGAIGGQGMYLIIGMIVLAGLMIFGVLNRFMSASSRSRPFDILTVGKIHPELILSAPDLEPRFGQVETLVDEAHLTVGNSSAIFTCGARRLGLQVAFMGGVGDDVFGRFTLESFQGRGVDTSAVVVDPSQQTGLSVILDRIGDRAILTHPGCRDVLRAEQVSDDLLRKARHLHVARYFQQTALQPGLPDLFKRAHVLGLTTSLDSDWDPSGEWRGIDELLKHVDVFLSNERVGCAIAGTPNLEEALRILSQLAGMAVMRRGTRGAVLRQGERVIRVPSLPVDRIDTVGADDTFDAGFLYGYLSGWDLPHSLWMGSVCGALSTRAAGGTAAQPTLEETSHYCRNP